jgi:adenine-specific DNA-methyltransferase
LANSGIVNSNPSSAPIPHIIKYMGSKKPIIEFIIQNIERIHHKKQPVCDLFAGSCSISAALREQFDFISNDIQEYSSILAHTYFSNFSFFDPEELIEQIELAASIHSVSLKRKFSALLIDFSKINDLHSFYEIENKQRTLLYQPFLTEEYFLFTKFYSGTYWSFEQCIWIDSYRKAAELYKGTEIYFAILSSIMYAMSYTTQSTGHFAQYRDGNTEEAMRNILYYRQLSLPRMFKKKFINLLSILHSTPKKVVTKTLDFSTCLQNLPQQTTVYADPPYAPVHYSRFYHALETLVKYDYPEVEFKGRYRKDRHQSPFSQKSNANQAFTNLFDGILLKKSQLLLSYSDSGVLPFQKILELAEKKFSKTHYTLDYFDSDHEHSTMGRFEDSKRSVKEYVIVAKRK